MNKNFSYIFIFLFAISNLFSQQVFDYIELSNEKFFGENIAPQYLNISIIQNAFIKSSGKVDYHKMARLTLNSDFNNDNFNSFNYYIQISNNMGISWDNVDTIPLVPTDTSYFFRDLSLLFPDENTIVLSARDTTPFILVSSKNNEVWSSQRKIRLSRDYYIPNIVMLNSKEGFGILLSYVSNHIFYSIIHTKDCWSTFEYVYVNPYTMSDPSIEIYNLKVLVKPDGDYFIAFTKKSTNKLIYITDHFATVQEVDFINDERIIQLEIFSDKIFYTMSEYYNGSNLVGNAKIHKTTDGGKTWQIIYEISAQDKNQIQQFKLLDTNNITLVGKLYDSSGHCFNFKRTIDGGKTWNYFYEDQEVFDRFAFKSELRKFKVSNIDFAEYTTQNELFFAAESYLSFYNANWQLKLNQPYSVRCKNFTLSNIAMDFGIKYCLTHKELKTIAPIIHIDDTSQSNNTIIYWNSQNGAVFYDVDIFKVNPYSLQQITYKMYTTKDTFLIISSCEKNVEHLIKLTCFDKNNQKNVSHFTTYQNNNGTTLKVPTIFYPIPEINMRTYSAGDITLKWEEIDSAEGYNIKLIELKDAFYEEPDQKLKYYLTYKIVEENYPNTELKFSGLNKNCKYILYVQAKNSAGVSNDAYITFRTNDLLQIQEDKEETQYIFPNPTTGYLYLKDFQLNGNVSLFNILGEKLQEICIKNNLQGIDLQNYPSGVYLLKNNNKTEKIIKL